MYRELYNKISKEIKSVISEQFNINDLDFSDDDHGYDVNIFNKECNHPYLEDGNEKTLTVVINADGESQYSQEEVSLPPGKYWIKENEPANDAYPLQEKVEVTVEADKTGEHAAIATFTNNINEDEATWTIAEDYARLSIENLFQTSINAQTNEKC